MSLRIVHYNDPILRKTGVRITEFDAALRKLADEMIDTMHAAAGIGRRRVMIDSVKSRSATRVPQVADALSRPGA